MGVQESGQRERESGGDQDMGAGDVNPLDVDVLSDGSRLASSPFSDATSDEEDPDGIFSQGASGAKSCYGGGAHLIRLDLGLSRLHLGETARHALQGLALRMSGCFPHTFAWELPLAPPPVIMCIHPQITVETRRLVQAEAACGLLGWLVPVSRAWSH